MTHLDGTTNHFKGKHLTEFERHQIQILKSENYSNRAIAKILIEHLKQLTMRSIEELLNKLSA
ncbi:helix-turn-helix domain-containing protein [Macrococcoides canis]|nr:helix-turn-helix domain-containing protein [Macrococcus canis]